MAILSNFPNNQCKMSFCADLVGGGSRIVVSGMDDFAMAKEFKTNDECLEMFFEIEKLDTINRADLGNLGFFID